MAVTMAGMSPFIRHPDIRLGLLLVVAALLLDMGSSGASWTAFVVDRLRLSAMPFGFLGTAGGLGSLFLVLAAIWVDRRPPHGMMVVGAAILAVGLVLITLSSSFGATVAGLFLVGTGRSAFGSLVFYAIAVKGFARFKGTLIGALGLVFGVNLGGGEIRSWDFGIPIGWLGVALVLTVGIALFMLLPRWFRGAYGPGLTLRETIAVSGVKARFASAAAVYLVAAMIITTGLNHLQMLATVASPTVGTAPEFGYRALALAGGLGALVWGAAADFFSVRWLLIALAVLSLPAAAWGWLLDDPGGGALLLSLVRGGLISLPWVLMADLLPKRHFAKLALAMTLLGTLGGWLGSLYQGAAMVVWGAESLIWVAIIEVIVLTAVVSFRPTDRGIGSWAWWWNKRTSRRSFKRESGDFLTGGTTFMP